MEILLSIGTALAGLFGKQIGGWPAKLLGGLAILILLSGGFTVAKALYDRSVIVEHEKEREAKASGAREDAADERAEDTIRQTLEERKLHDVIDEASPSGELSPAARALACERLRRVGRIPPACRSESGNGDQATSP